MPVAGSTMNALASTTSSNTGLDTSQTSYYSTTFTMIIACLIPLVALMYIAVFSWVYHRAKQNPKALNKATGRVIDRYAPLVYLYLLCLSVIEVGFSSWILLQYRVNQNYPSVEAQTGTTTLLFSACWTTITAGIYAILFIHPTWSSYLISSVGAQAIWVFVTWLLWIISSGMINAAVPSALVKGTCDGVVYCRQIQWMFALSVVQTLSLTAALGVLAWMAWQSTRGVIQKEESSAEWQ
ncbi:hypothetical protein M378DRAFT_15490 [Amanita muscaria Koide BX008]|uniref:MARVEL domain-containing protein n=1 Tax=Amanita muscaria (strain Koide BX008) TaxID=946122 RepID=A0A0C2WP95_AMAMK|nr:hypothetical protein M378DRAFT_15490 [Amanita muscaria Koide BX008]